MTGLLQAVQKTIDIAAPVLCLDTCALLDLMRDPQREKFNSLHATAATRLLAQAEAHPPKLVLVIAAQVVRELADHMDSIEVECEAALSCLDKTIENVFGIFTSYGIKPSVPLPEFAKQGFSTNARTFVDRFSKTAIVIDEHETPISRAWHRVADARAPAKLGKQSMKDCVIVETYLEFAHHLRCEGFAEKIAFLTTNTTDYVNGKSGTQVHSDLMKEFTSARLEFSVNFEMARYLLTTT